MKTDIELYTLMVKASVKYAHDVELSYFRSFPLPDSITENIFVS